MEIIRKFKELNSTKRLKIAVVGDTMVDDYKYGQVTRVSPEFPVQVLTSQSERVEQVPGGAGNVCCQMTHFNAEVHLLGFLDKPARRLYDEFGFNISRCVNLENGRVPIKTRFYDGDFPLLRWDIEAKNYGERQEDMDELRYYIFYNFIDLLEKDQPDVVILSDYDKGLWDGELAGNIIQSCKKKGIPTLVDPKKDLKRWRGCTTIKPNAQEAEALTGQKSWQGQADALKDSQNVVITQSGSGVAGRCGDKYFEYRPKLRLSAKEVNSVIGAGDCFLAVLAVATGYGMSLEDACKLAFEGGVQYVKARHNKPITPHDIHERLDPVGSKIISPEELSYLMKTVYAKEEFVFTNGCFDVLHPGHIDTLRFAKSKGDRLIVGLNSDASVAALKGPTRPVRTWDDRAYLLAALDCVDFVVKFEDATPEGLVKKLKPTYLVKGGDYTPEEVVGKDHVKEVFIAPTREGHSTTAFLKNVAGEHK